MMDAAARFGPLGRPYKLLHGVPTAASELAGTLRRLGWVSVETASIALVVDIPWGSAFQTLRTDGARGAVVVTDNPCPEYWEDLWQQHPAALLAGGCSVAEMAGALGRAYAGETFRRTPSQESRLTASERRLLQLTALGLENKRIARELHVTEGTVKNGLGRVYLKLGLTNRTQLALYYWGLWVWLEGFSIQPSVP